MPSQAKQRAWRLYCRARTALGDLRKGKLKGHYVEAVVVSLLLFTVLTFVFWRPETTKRRKIHFHFKDIQVEANYHREQLLKIHKEKDHLDRMESFHSSAFAKLSTEFEEALAKGVYLVNTGCFGMKH